MTKYGSCDLDFEGDIHVLLVRLIRDLNKYDYNDHDNEGSNLIVS